MTVPVQFWSYFRDLAGTSRIVIEIPEGGTVDALLDAVYAAHPKLGALRQSTLIAVGVEYQGRTYVLRPGDEVSLFPPVQGG
ncbi:MAG: MoaD/ThiS family protein [Verrucomicrobiae bacterium]|nr:MoaD/ThiS family protein [Verrucomicrobiae bacterium]